jgi:hypothetical protein
MRARPSTNAVGGRGEKAWETPLFDSNDSENLTNVETFNNRVVPGVPTFFEVKPTASTLNILVRHLCPVRWCRVHTVMFVVFPITVCGVRCNQSTQRARV